MARDGYKLEKLTETRPPGCATTGCAHEWSAHTDAESMEDPRIGDREPCGVHGCGCQDFTYASADRLTTM